ncbi:MAG: hypothetical protein Q9171_003022 [Xanthocarpia ochracea]
MSADRRGSDSAGSTGGIASTVPAHEPTTSAQRVLSTTWRGQQVEVTLPYPDSTAPRTDSNLPRAYQKLPERHRFKRRTDIESPYVRIQTPKLPEPKESTMADHRKAPTAPASQGTSAKKRSTYKEQPKQRSLLDGDIEFEGWPAQSIDMGHKVKKEVEKTRENEEEYTMELPLDRNREACLPTNYSGKRTGTDRRNIWEELYKLGGLDMDNAAISTTDTPTTETKATSATTSSDASEGMKIPRDQVKRYLAASGDVVIKGLSNSHFDDIQPTSTTFAKDPHTLATDTPSDSTNASSKRLSRTPSPTSSESLPQSTKPHSTITTVQCQEYAKETQAPLHPLGTEISVWAAQTAALDPAALRVDQERENGGYVRRFTRKGKASEAEPTKENSVVKYDPFGGLWGYAAGKFDAIETRTALQKTAAVGKQTMIEEKKEEKEEKGEKKEKEEKKKKEEKEVMTPFDELEGFLNPGMRQD